MRVYDVYLFADDKCVPHFEEIKGSHFTFTINNYKESWKGDTAVRISFNSEHELTKFKNDVISAYEKYLKNKE